MENVLIPTDEINKKSVFHLITTSVPTTAPNTTIRDIKKIITDQDIHFDSINYLYVLDHNKKLTGVLSIKEVMDAEEKEPVGHFMQKRIVSISPHAHREHAAHLALKHNIKEIPVVDKAGNFIGVVSSDMILKITNDEVTEDMMLLEGIFSKDYADVATPTNSPFHLLQKRLPWLIVGLAGGLLAAQIIGFFESLLEQEVLLISFLPLMVYMSDAVGSQSQTIFIRYVALNNGVSFFSYLFKELVVGFLMACVLGLLLSVISGILYSPFISLVIGVSLFCAVLLSIFIAIFIPWVLIKLHKDPAVGSGPFATIMRDILSIVVYFSVSQLIYSF